MSLKAARSKRDELAKAVHDGISPAKQKQLEKFALANSTSVADFSERYFREVIEKDRKDTKQPFLQFRAEFFNLNNVNLTNPNGTLTSPLFGQISGSANARIIQFALKYNF